MHNVVLMPQAEKSIERIMRSDRSHFERIMRGLDLLAQEPYAGKALVRELKGKYSLRVGSYRVIYTVENKVITIFVLDVGHRKDIYFR